MYKFDVTIHACPGRLASSSLVRLGDRQVSPLAVHPDQLTAAMPLSFEEASSRLEAFDNMIIEPDGSFVWTSGSKRPRWQVDGILYDRNDALLFMQLKGYCPKKDFDRILRVVGWPEFELMFLLNRHAIYVDEPELRRFVWQNQVGS